MHLESIIIVFCVCSDIEEEVRIAFVTDPQAREFLRLIKLRWAKDNLLNVHAVTNLFTIGGDDDLDEFATCATSTRSHILITRLFK
jgi:hypothetical protein